MSRALSDLIALRGDIDALIVAVGKDAKANTASERQALNRADVDRALARYLDGSLSEGQLVAWADTLEMREAVEYEWGAEQVIATVLFRLATPEINEPISRPLANELRNQLRAPIQD